MQAVNANNKTSWQKVQESEARGCWFRPFTVDTGASLAHSTLALFLSEYNKASDAAANLSEDELLKLRLAAKHRVELAIRHHFGNRFHVEFFGSIQYVQQVIFATP